MNKYKWIEINRDTECYTHIMDLGHFCLIRTGVYDSNDDKWRNCNVVKITKSDVDQDLHNLVKRK